MTVAASKRRIELFRQARKIITSDAAIPPTEKESVIKLIEALIEAAESTASTRGKADDHGSGQLTQEFISRYSLISLVRQQADELDSLKKLSLNLTSSLDLQTVLDAVVAEAMRLVRNARTAHIFL